MTVFIPAPTPVWCGGTACTIRFPSAANASPMPTPSNVAEISMSYGWACMTASQTNASAVIAQPTITANREP